MVVGCPAAFDINYVGTFSGFVRVDLVVWRK
ncbi:hypothetical protein MESS4_660088 [Mesorhizobium sp. STM 4661]|nr:hypothetical protein MESS4_660088 [Mesorhizobium sp. STM 4661]